MTRVAQDQLLPVHLLLRAAQLRHHVTIHGADLSKTGENVQLLNDLGDAAKDWMVRADNLKHLVDQFGLAGAELLVQLSVAVAKLPQLGRCEHSDLLFD